MSRTGQVSASLTSSHSTNENLNILQQIRKYFSSSDTYISTLATWVSSWRRPELGSDGVRNVKLAAIARSRSAQVWCWWLVLVLVRGCHHGPSCCEQLTAQLATALPTDNIASLPPSIAPTFCKSCVS